MRARLVSGRSFALNIKHSHVTAQNVDPEKWARELGVLQP